MGLVCNGPVTHVFATPDSAHESTKRAIASTARVTDGHGEEAKAALHEHLDGMLEASRSGDSAGASATHAAMAEWHETQAHELRKAGDVNLAAEHEKAHASHLHAAKMHAAMGGDEESPEEDAAESPADEATETNNARGRTMNRRPIRDQDADDVLPHPTNNYSEPADPTVNAYTAPDGKPLRYRPYGAPTVVRNAGAESGNADTYADATSDSPPRMSAADMLASMGLRFDGRGIGDLEDESTGETDAAYARAEAEREGRNPLTGNAGDDVLETPEIDWRTDSFGEAGLPGLARG
jgi:hypothetical protein